MACATPEARRVFAFHSHVLHAGRIPCGMWRASARLEHVVNFLRV